MRRAIANRIGPLEAVGLKPLGAGVRQCVRALRGDEHLPRARADLSSLRIFRPLLGPATWLGWTPRDRRLPILNLFNHDAADRSAGYDVRTTRVRDFRGGSLTYNGHMGTDFVAPVGTTVVAPAAGRVLRVQNLMHRGGLKVAIDHGRGLTTHLSHLARACVSAGDMVARGERVGWSGFSSIDGILFLPWVPPHVHMTVTLNGEPVDPFAAPGELPLWRDGNDPRPARRTESAPIDAGDALAEEEFDEDAIEASVASCRDPEIRRELEAAGEDRGLLVAYWRVYAHGTFDAHPPLYRRAHPRAPRLDLPFTPEECSGVALP